MLYLFSLFLTAILEAVIGWIVTYILNKFVGKK